MNCEAQITERLLHFVSKQAFDIDGLGKTNIHFLFEKGIVKTPQDIFTIESKNDQLRLQDFENWGQTSVKNLFASINNSRTITLDRFIYALGIPQVGNTASKMIAKFFGSYSKMFECLSKNALDSLLTVDGIGESILNDIKNFFANENNINTVIKLSEVVTIVDAKNVVDGPLSGKIVVFTGTLELLPRAEAQQLAEKAGAKISSSISSKTSLLVAGKNAGSKLAIAQKFGINTISEADFKKIIEQKMAS